MPNLPQGPYSKTRYVIGNFAAKANSISLHQCRGRIPGLQGRHQADEASFVNGAEIAVDGGTLAR
jgi:hypothetical protein